MAAYNATQLVILGARRVRLLFNAAVYKRTEVGVYKLLNSITEKGSPRFWSRKVSLIEGKRARNTYKATHPLPNCVAL